MNDKLKEIKVIKKIKIEPLNRIMKLLNRNNIKIHNKNSQLPYEEHLSLIRQLPTKIGLPTSDGIHLINWSDIIYCSADSNYCKVHFADGRMIIISRTLKSMEAMLPKQHFIRIHQSYLVRLSAITMVKSNEIQLNNKQSFPIAQSKKVAFMKRLHDYIAY